MKKFITIFIFLGVILMSCFAEKYTSSSIIEKLSDCIKQNHPNPFIKISKKKFDSEIISLKKDIEEKNKEEQIFALRRLVALIGDAHTKVIDKTTNKKKLPFIALPYTGHSIIVQVESQYSELAGKELLKINNIDIKTILQKFLPIISYDTTGYAELLCHYECYFSDSLKFINVINNETEIPITVKDTLSNTIKTFTVKLTDGITKPTFAHLAPTLSQSRYYYANLIDKNTLFIQYNVCEEIPDLPMNRFSDILTEKLSSNLPQKIIVDLRHNTGGNSYVIKPLLKTLKNFITKGSKIFCLIGAETFSSGVMAASDLKEIGAILVGEEVGWNCRFGEVKELPLTENISLYYSTKDFAKYFKNGIPSPSFLVKQNIRDLANGIDTCVEYIKSK